MNKVTIWSEDYKNYGIEKVVIVGQKMDGKYIFKIYELNGEEYCWTYKSVEELHAAIKKNV